MFAPGTQKCSLHKHTRHGETAVSTAQSSLGSHCSLPSLGPGPSPDSPLPQTLLSSSGPPKSPHQDLPRPDPKLFQASSPLPVSESAHSDRTGDHRTRAGKQTVLRTLPPHAGWGPLTSHLSLPQCSDRPREAPPCMHMGAGPCRTSLGSWCRGAVWVTRTRSGCAGALRLEAAGVGQGS